MPQNLRADDRLQAPGRAQRVAHHGLGGADENLSRFMFSSNKAKAAAMSVETRAVSVVQYMNIREKLGGCLMA